MRKYLIQRALSIIPMLFAISILSYIIMNSAPGGPAMMFLPPGQTEMTPEQVAHATEILGLNQPVIVRYFKWLAQILHGNFGNSYFTGRPVLTEIRLRIGATLALTGSSMVLNMTIGILLGIYAATHRNRLSDRLITTGSLVSMSLPEVWLALMMIMLFSGVLKWLPAVGLSDSSLRNPTAIQWLVDRVRHLIMPVLIITVGGTAGLVRYQRGAMLDVLHQDYIRTARSKGLDKKTVELRHALRNATLPLITMMSGTLAGLFSGAVIIESIFGLPGIGLLFTTSIGRRDYPVIMGLTLITSALLMAGTLICDILYTFADPRIRYSE